MNFDELFDDVYPGLYRYCLRLTADPDWAEDTTQEAFVRLLDRSVRGDFAGLRAWLFKVATHLIRDRARVRAKGSLGPTPGRLSGMPSNAGRTRLPSHRDGIRRLSARFRGTANRGGAVGAPPRACRTSQPRTP